MTSPLEYTPIRARRGKVVHAFALRAGSPDTTACGKRCSGYVIALEKLGCRDCKLMLGKACRAARRKVAS